jgi:ribonuclease T2
MFARSHAHASHARGDFDYYLMALSWSPSYCLTHLDDTEQCSKGYGFVLHGLWPQNRNGSWPSRCDSRAEPDDATIDRTLAFMPSRGLIRHEWSTHGACSGLDPRAYFELADRAFAAVAVPPPLRTPQRPPQLSADGLVAAFAAANPGMNASMLSVQCRNGGELSEVRICLDRDSLAPQACGGRVRNTCRSGPLRITAAR